MGKTKRRRFLDKCYEVQDRYLDMIEKNMRRSEKRSPNRELTKLSNTIKSKIFILILYRYQQSRSLRKSADKLH